MQELITFIGEAMQYPIVRGAVAGVASAAVVDVGAFRSWKSAQEALEYQWGIAAWRWFQGAVVGAITGAGFSLAS